MIVKMLEHYQDASVHLYPDKEVEVNDALGEWLLKHRKAVQVIKRLESEPQFEQAEEPPHYGAQPEPEPRQDEIKHQAFRNRKSGRRAA